MKSIWYEIYGFGFSGQFKTASEAIRYIKDHITPGTMLPYVARIEHTVICVDQLEKLAEKERKP